MSTAQTPMSAANNDASGIDFDRWRRTVGLFLGPAVALLILLIPISGLSTTEHRLAAIAALMIIYWISEALPFAVTSLLGMALIVVFGVAPPNNVLSALGDQVIFLIMGSFILARAIQVNHLDQRIAYLLLANEWVGGKTVRTIVAMGLAAWLLSTIFSNTATVAMLTPVGLVVARSTARAMHTEETPENIAERRKYTTGLLLTLAYASTAGGLATPIGSPTNLIGIALIENQLNTNVHFLEWMAFGLPFAVVLFGLIIGVSLLFFRPSVRSVPGQLEELKTRQRQLGPLSAGERNCLIALGLAVALWFFPDVLTIALGAHNSFAEVVNQRLLEGVAVIFAVSLLFVLPTNWKKRQFTLTWDDASKIGWGTLLLFAGGIALGQVLFSSGLAKTLGDELVALLGTDTWIINSTSVVTAVILTETTSGVASANIVVPVMLVLAGSADPALVAGLAATLGATMGFMLPVSTPPNAIVYETGEIRFFDMVRAGFLISIGAAIFAIVVSLVYLPVVTGL